MLHQPVRTSAIVAALALGSPALNLSLASISTGPEVPKLKAPGALNIDALPLYSCPPERELITKQDPKGFSEIERARINAAVHLLETTMPDAPWVMRLRKIEWVKLTPDATNFAEQAKAEHVMKSPVTYLKRSERLLFSFNGNEFQTKEYLLVPSPAKKEFTPAEFAVVLAYWLSVEMNSRDVCAALDSRAKMYQAQAEVAKTIFDSLGGQITLAPQEELEWKSDLDRLALEGCWLSHHNRANKELADCSLTLRTISKQPQLNEQQPELAKRLDELKEAINAWVKTAPTKLKNADQGYDIYSKIDGICGMIEATHPDLHRELREKARNFGNSLDDYNMFLLHLEDLREQQRQEKEKTKNGGVIIPNPDR